MLSDYEIINGTLDCADASVEHCPFCGSDYFHYLGEGKYYCDACEKEFEISDCDFCENCGEQVSIEDNIMDEDGAYFCSQKCLSEYYRK